MEASERSMLRSLLAQPVAALATLHRGRPAVSMVPFALLPGGHGLVVHVSRLATHTADMLAEPSVSLLLTATLDPGTSPLALPRASLQGLARPLAAHTSGYDAARTAYLAKLPDALELFSFADFGLFEIEVDSVRFVAGFGRAMSLTGAHVHEALQSE